MQYRPHLKPILGLWVCVLLFTFADVAHLANAAPVVPHRPQWQFIATLLCAEEPVPPEVHSQLTQAIGIGR